MYIELPATIITATKLAVAVLYTLATLTFVGIPEIVGLLPMRETWRQSLSPHCVLGGENR